MGVPVTAGSPRRLEQTFTVVAVAVPVTIIVLMVVGEWVRSRDRPGESVPSSGVSTRGAPGISPRELAGAFQGWTRKVDGSTEWTVLRIDDVGADGRFAYTLNVGQHRRDGAGTFAGSGGMVTLGKLRGKAERTEDGSLTIQSWPPEVLPIWQVFGSAGRTSTDARGR
jgi:hypothetical protein